MSELYYTGVTSLPENVAVIAGRMCKSLIEEAV